MLKVVKVEAWKWTDHSNNDITRMVMFLDNGNSIMCDEGTDLSFIF